MPLISTSLLDLRYSLRQLRRSPGFTLTAILTLALGIGATSAVYSVVRSTLLSALPYPQPSRLVGIGFIPPAEPPEAEQTGETADFLLQHATGFSSLGVADDGPRDENLSIPQDHGQPLSQTVRALGVSAGYLPTLGVAPLLGHTFTTAEDLPGAAPTAVLSESLWRRAFNADPGVVGRVLHLNSDTDTVVGVMPTSFTTADSPDLWHPLHLSPTDPGYIGDNYQFIGRLRPGVSLAQAAAELSTLSSDIYRQFPTYNRWDGPGAPRRSERLFPLQQVLVSHARPSLLALWAAVLAVLLLACLNLAGLSTARAATRSAEIAVRSALGARSSAIVRLLLTESAVLAFVGSLFGLALARVFLALLVRNSPVDLPALHPPSIDLHSALFVTLAGSATVVLVGLVPALGALRHGSSTPLRGTHSVGRTLSSNRLGRVLLLAQVSLAATLLSAGALFLGTFLHLRARPSGVRPEQLFALQVNLKGTAFASSTHTQQFIAAVETRLRALPGVRDVATINGLPLDQGLNNHGGDALHPDRLSFTQTRFITPGYFRTAGIPLLAGTDTSPSDSASTPPVALINQRAAHLWFPDQPAVGASILDGGTRMRVIGIVADVQNASLAEAAQPTVYIPYAQVSDESMAMINGWFPTTFLLRTSPSARGQTAGAGLARAASAIVTSVDPDVPASKFVPMQAFLDRTVAAPRFFSWLAGGFALFALFLTVIGLFGLLSYQVAARTREIGVRMALGSSRSRVLTLVLANGLLITSCGLALGILAGIVLRHPLSLLLADATEVNPRDLTPLLTNRLTSALVTTLAMVCTAFVAALLPARRAASIDPNTALRTE